MIPANIDQLTDFGIWILENHPELFYQYLTLKSAEKPTEEYLPQFHKPKFKTIIMEETK
jgi:hypothetical protein